MDIHCFKFIKDYVNCTVMYLLHKKIQYRIVLYCTILCCTVLYCAVLCCPVLYSTMLSCTVPYYHVLYRSLCTLNYSIVLYTSAPHCTLLYFNAHTSYLDPPIQCAKVHINCKCKNYWGVGWFDLCKRGLYQINTRYIYDSKAPFIIGEHSL